MMVMVVVLVVVVVVMISVHLRGSSQKAPAEPRLRSTRKVVKEFNWQEHCQGLAPRCLMVISMRIMVISIISLIEYDANEDHYSLHMVARGWK